MLQTYILSLALNYHPDQIRFILVDYKGGGMADAFRNLPHVTGIIDNLQTGNTIARALASIQGEIHRREHIFREADVNNIDDYIRFYYDDPTQERLPHLIIIVDEFAELKADQPDFMRELISASRFCRRRSPPTRFRTKSGQTPTSRYACACRAAATPWRCCTARTPPI